MHNEDALQTTVKKTVHSEYLASEPFLVQTLRSGANVQIRRPLYWEPATPARRKSGRVQFTQSTRELRERTIP